MALECSVCLQEFKSPKILPCFHTFCEKCLSSLVSKAAGQIREEASPGAGLSFPCPMCRAITTVPEGGVCAFQDNFYISAEVQLNPTEASATAFPACDVCTSRDKTTPGDPAGKGSEFKCAECDKFLCSDCTAIHNELLSSHTLVSVTAAGKLKISRKAFCQKHPTEELRFFCTRCQTPVCRDCRMTSHAEGHTSVDLEDVSEKAKELVTKAAHYLSSQLIPHYKLLMTSLADDLQRKRDLADSIKELIGTRVSELQKTLEEVKAHALKTVDETACSLEEDSRIHYDQLTRLQSQSDHISRVLEGGCEADIVVAAENVKASLAKITVLDQQVNSCRRTIAYDRSDTIHIKEMSESGYLRLDEWASFAARYVGKALVHLEENDTDILLCERLIQWDAYQFREVLTTLDFS